MNHIDDLTIVIKTFLRPDSCEELLKSIREYYPDVPVIIVNDGDGEVWEGPHTKTITMSFDSGLSAGRNEGVKHVETKYFVLCDDDFVFNERTDLQLFKDLLIDSDVDILGGHLSNHFDYQWCLFKSKDSKDVREHSVPHKTLDNGVVVVDYCLNFFVAKTETLRNNPWGTKKVNEHSLWFWNNVGNFTVGWTDRVSCRHAQNRSSKRYMGYRMRA